MVAPRDCVTGLIINAAFNDAGAEYRRAGHKWPTAPVLIAILSLVPEGLIQPVTDIGGFVYRFDGTVPEYARHLILAENQGILCVNSRWCNSILPRHITLPLRRDILRPVERPLQPRLF